MLSVDIDINGRQVRRLEVVNTGEVNRCGEHKYRAYDRDTDDGERDFIGHVHHDRDDGAEALSQKALECLLASAIAPD